MFLLKFLFRPLSSDRTDRKIGQLLMFILAPLFFAFGCRAVARYAGTPGEAVNGLLLTITATLLFLITGYLLPLAAPAKEI